MIYYDDKIAFPMSLLREVKPQKGCGKPGCKFNISGKCRLGDNPCPIATIAKDIADARNASMAEQMLYEAFTGRQSQQEVAE